MCVTASVCVCVCGWVGWQSMPEDTHLKFSNFTYTDCQMCLMWVINGIWWLTTVFNATFRLCPWHQFTKHGRWLILQWTPYRDAWIQVMRVAVQSGFLYYWLDEFIWRKCFLPDWTENLADCGPRRLNLGTRALTCKAGVFMYNKLTAPKIIKLNHCNFHNVWVHLREWVISWTGLH